MNLDDSCFTPLTVDKNSFKHENNIFGHDVATVVGNELKDIYLCLDGFLYCITNGYVLANTKLGIFLGMPPIDGSMALLIK